MTHSEKLKFHTFIEKILTDEEKKEYKKFDVWMQDLFYESYVRYGDINLVNLIFYWKRYRLRKHHHMPQYLITKDIEPQKKVIGFMI